MTEKRNRFPGAKPFTYDDKEVFYGRGSDVERLYELLKMKRVLVLYSESGIGKSSLVNAGLIPKYQASKTGNQFLAVKIRFGLSPVVEAKEIPETLLLKIIDELKLYKSLLKDENLPLVKDEIKNSLWYALKIFEKNGINILLIFDQFEEVFTYSRSQLDLFKEQVGSLFRGIPKNLDLAITAKIKLVEEQVLEQQELIQLEEDLKFIYASLNTQILFVIREEKLGLFNSFTDYFPDILKDTFKLLPLSRRSAAEAIKLPAAKDGHFKTPPFTFSQPAVLKLLNRLAEKNDIYDPFTIQLTCRYIEKTLIDEAKKRQIEEEDIPEVGIIVKDFIDGTWKALPRQLHKNIDSFKEIIETKLISPDIEKRISVHESNWINNEVVTVLLNEGLLKRDRRGGADYIELSHDRLIKPLLEDYEFRKQNDKFLRQQKKNTRIVAAVILTVIFIAAGFIIFYNQHEEEDKANVEMIEQLTRSNEGIVTSKQIPDKDTTIEQIKEVYIDSADKCISLAKIEAAGKNYEKANVYFNLALFMAQQLHDTVRTNYIEKQINELIPAAFKHKSGVFDVFYDERTVTQSEETADSIINMLSRNKNFIIRKRLLTIVRINSNPTWNIQNNIIRSEANKEERSLVDSLINTFNSNKFIENNNKKFSIQEVKKGYKTPNYISIFIRN